MNDASAAPSSRPRRRWWRGVGWALCGAGLAAGFFGCWLWFRAIDGARDELKENVFASGENRLSRWHSLRDRFRGGRFAHDDMIRAGQLGDTEAIELIMNRLPAKGQANGCFGCVGPPHAAEQLRLLTAQDAGDMAEGWHAWWRVHQGKSQATLIR